MLTLGEKISDLRKERKMTQEALAKNLNITKATISRWENDSIIPNKIFLEKIADIFNTTCSYLLGETDDSKSKKEKDLSDVTKVSYSDLDDPQSAMEFILKQPAMMAFGGYRLDLMDEEEIVEFAQNMLSLMKMAAERYKNKK
ncbi:MAG: helix-turn-helix domain-containing protein [Fusobacteriaceae bacterium]